MRASAVRTRHPHAPVPVPWSRRDDERAAALAERRWTDDERRRAGPETMAGRREGAGAAALGLAPVGVLALAPPPANAKTAYQTYRAVVDAIDVDALVAIHGPLDLATYLFGHPAPALAFSALLFFGIPVLTRLAVKYVVIPSVVFGTLVLVLADPSASADFVSSVFDWAVGHPRVLSVTALVVAGVAISPYILFAGSVAALIALASGVLPLVDGFTDDGPSPLEFLLPPQAKEAKQAASQAARQLRAAEDRAAEIRSKAEEKTAGFRNKAEDIREKAQGVQAKAQDVKAKAEDVKAELERIATRGNANE